MKLLTSFKFRMLWRKARARYRVFGHVTLTSAGVGPCKAPQGTPARVAGRNQLEDRNPNRTENVENGTHDVFLDWRASMSPYLYSHASRRNSEVEGETRLNLQGAVVDFTPQIVFAVTLRYIWE